MKPPVLDYFQPQPGAWRNAIRVALRFSAALVVVGAVPFTFEVPYVIRRLEDGTLFSLLSCFSVPVTFVAALLCCHWRIVTAAPLQFSRPPSRAYFIVAVINVAVQSALCRLAFAREESAIFLLLAWVIGFPILAADMAIRGSYDRPAIRAAKDELRRRNPDWRIYGARVRAREPSRRVIAVFYSEPDTQYRPIPYTLMSVSHDLARVEELARKPESPYWIRGRK